MTALLADKSTVAPSASRRWSSRRHRRQEGERVLLSVLSTELAKDLEQTLNSESFQGVGPGLNVCQVRPRHADAARHLSLTQPHGAPPLTRPGGEAATGL